MSRISAALAMILLLAGCTSQTGASDAGSQPAVGMPGSAGDGVTDLENLPVNRGELGGDAGGSAGGSAGGAAQPSAAPMPGKSATTRQVITTGTLSMTVDDPLKAAEEAASRVESAGGHVAESNERPATDTSKASAHLVLRIPTEKLPATLAELKKLGTVNNSSQASADVTTQVRDLDARVTALQTSVDRLLELISKATATKDLLEIETTLSQRQAELESLQSQRAYLADQVALSTLTLDLLSEGTVAAAAPGDFWAGLIAGWDALVVAAGAALVVLGVALPWLVVVALIAAAVWWLRTLRRKKSASAV